MFVFASRVDTLGLVNMEAMSSGVPVLVPSDAFIAEFVTDGLSAECYEFGPAGLSKAIARILDDPLHAQLLLHQRPARDDRALERGAVQPHMEVVHAERLKSIRRRRGRHLTGRGADLAARRVAADAGRLPERAADAPRAGAARRGSDVLRDPAPRIAARRSTRTRRRCAFLRELADGGATLVMHGLTHRMLGRAWTPARLVSRARLRARAGRVLSLRRRRGRAPAEEGREIFRRAGLESALRGFIPPAWLLSPRGARGRRRAPASSSTRLSPASSIAGARAACRA